MKKALVAVAAVTALALATAGLAQAAPPVPSGAVKWNGASDKAVSVTIDATANTTRTNASGVKITSNAHSTDFPGIYFIWDSKQADNGFLKVASFVFDTYDSFVLTSKEANTYWDFTIALQPGQQATEDGGYVFWIPKVFNNKNINMVFLDRWTMKTAPLVTRIVNLGFIGYYVDSLGVVRSTSPYWQALAEGVCIDWEAVEAAYADWAGLGGLSLPDPTKGWQSSGIASFHADGATPELCYADFTEGQLESYYGAWYLDPGYDSPEVVVAYGRYLADVHLWNDLYQADGPFRALMTEDDIKILVDKGGLAHYHALLAAYGAEELPPYYHFDSGDIELYNHWADDLEAGLQEVLARHPEILVGVSLSSYQASFDTASFVNP
ncbi:MAG: hypothetical protein LBE83_04335 [Propionibacteriaceae bacterium]|jgi:hypothetical protein|nr:hypothetical protein [Propionibacteriaceae bacterium]